MKEIIDYIGTEEFLKNYAVELTGLITDILLLSILIPLFLWIKNYRARRLKRFAILTNVFRLFNSVLDQFTLLFEFNKLRGNTEDPVHKYWILNVNRLYNKSYSYEALYGNLVTKIFCIEDHSFNKKLLENDFNKLKEIESKIDEELEKFDRFLLFEIEDQELNDLVRLLKVTIGAVNEELKIYLNEKTEEHKSKLFNSINVVALLMLETFYKHEKFYNNYFNFQELRASLILKEIASPRDQVLPRYVRLENKRNSRLFGWGQLFLLIAIIMQNFRRNHKS